MNIKKICAILLVFFCIFSVTFFSVCALSDGSVNATNSSLASKAPPKPKKLTVSSRTDNSIKLTWSKVKKADGYRVYIYKNKKWKTLATTSELSYKANSLSPGREYKFSVKPYALVDGKRVWTKGGKRIVAVTRPSAPSEITALKKAYSVNLSWEKVKGATGYRVSGYDNGWKKLKDIQENAYTVEGLDALTEYTFSVKAYIKTESGKVLSIDRTTVTVKTKKRPVIKKTGRTVINPQQKLWNLVVVNGGRQIPEGYVPKLKTVAGSNVKLDYRVAPWYDKMYNAAKKDGIILKPYSGYRTVQRQTTNFNSLVKEYMYEFDISKDEATELAATLILPPGCSEHNLGLAMDICNTKDSFAKSKEFKWLKRNAHKYGFILRYAEEKQDITGVTFEPWHWRFVGVEYAKKIKKSGLCLEEYLSSNGISY